MSKLHLTKLPGNIDLDWHNLLIAKKEIELFTKKKI